jgi:hypothetical protein
MHCRHRSCETEWQLLAGLWTRMGMNQNKAARDLVVGHVIVFQPRLCVGITDIAVLETLGSRLGLLFQYVPISLRVDSIERA